MSEPETDPEANPDPDPGTARDGRTDATGGGNGNDRPSYTELAARVEELSAKNDQLRQQVAAATRARYRRSAIVMALVGVVALAGAALFPDVRTVLVALGGTGVFAAVLTYFLTPERFVAASVGEAVYATLADNEAAVVDDLDLRGEPHVVPGRGPAAPARLFVPLDAGVDVPEETDHVAPFGVEDRLGLFLQPTGAPLYESFREAAGTLPGEPPALARSVGDALVEQFELVDGVEADVEAGRATLAVDGSVYGPVDRFDHPVASLFATTLAVELDEPVALEVGERDESGGWRVTCRWGEEVGEPDQTGDFELDNIGSGA
jgi:hypothetical protein